VDNPHAAEAHALAFLNKRAQRDSRLNAGHAVQVDFILDREIAAPELPPYLARDLRALKREFIAGLDLETIGRMQQRFLEHRAVVFAREFCPGFGAWFLRKSAPTADGTDFADVVPE